MNFFAVALMYLGAVMGAGFASGREAWQYFGVFGHKAYYGLIIEAVLFMALGFMVCYIARVLHTDNVNHIILPVRSKVFDNILNAVIGMLLYIPLISMSAAGGALLNQQLGIHRAFGGGAIVIMVICTLLGDFERMQKVFRFIMPALFLIIIVIAFTVAIKYPSTGDWENIKPSKLASSWPLAGVLYVSYNSLGTIPIMAKSAMRAKDKKQALGGAVMGGAMLASLGVMLVMALQKDPKLSDRLDLPLLGYAKFLSPVVEILFALVLLLAIYSAATSCFYGCISRFPDTPERKYILIGLAIGAFFIGLVGFKNIVALVYPVKGYIDLCILILLICNFIKIISEERRKLYHLKGVRKNG